MGEHGWPFASADSFPGTDNDPVNGAQHVKDLYLKVKPDYEGRCVLSPTSYRTRADSRIIIP